MIVLAVLVMYVPLGLFLIHLESGFSIIEHYSMVWLKLTSIYIEIEDTQVFESDLNKVETAISSSDGTNFCTKSKKQSTSNGID